MVGLNDNFSESEKRFLLQYIEREGHPLSSEEIITRLNLNEPIDYILGYTYFYNLRLKVNGSTLIPRPETEELVEFIINEHQGTSPIKILDIGTGSGCIALALEAHIQNSSVHAIDFSEPALTIARENAHTLNSKIEFHKIDILEEASWSFLGKYDIIVSNPPYIPRDEKGAMTCTVLNYEPHEALFVEQDPLLFYRKILNFASTHLEINGIVYFETSQAIQLDSFDGFDLEKIKDLSGNWRFLRCRKRESFLLI